MAQTYKGTLTLEWYNKDKSIILKEDGSPKSDKEIPAPRINWINKEDSLFYEISNEEGRGLTPYWVPRSDIRVKESRPLVFQKSFIAEAVEKPGSLPGMGEAEYRIKESDTDDPAIDNILIKGDNLLALNTLKKIFDGKPDEEKVKCIYIDPPYNTGSAFEHYDDNLEHSEWLTMMRDRLAILRDLLREDGVIFISIDNRAQAYLKILLDEIFGCNNFIECITVVNDARARDYGVIANVHEFLLVYSKSDKLECYKLKNINKKFNYYDDLGGFDIYELRNRNSQFNISNRPNLYYAFWLNPQKIDENGFYEISLERKDGFIEVYPAKSQGIQTVWRWGKEKALENLNINLVGKKTNNGEYQIVKKYREINYLSPSVWSDGDIKTDRGTLHLKSLFNNKKVFDFPKPEEMIQRILEISTKKNDIILDCFGGSGTTFSTALKMKRKWIGIEIGNQIDLIVINRLKKVISGKDNGGISKTIGWHGGGSFKYYYLGESIIDFTKRDFNWKLDKKFIEESLLSSYDYIIESGFKTEDKLFEDSGERRVAGFKSIGNKTFAAVVTLVSPDETNDIMSKEEINGLYKALKKKNPHYITIFTNRGVEIPYDFKPDDMEIVKVPNALFVEME